MSNNVNHPNHYLSSSGIEVIDAIEAWELGFNRGNCIKYVARAGRKNRDKEIEDLEKAQWYLNREIERLKKNTISIFSEKHAPIYHSKEEEVYSEQTTQGEN